MIDGPLLTISEFARRCGVSRRAVYHWLRLQTVRSIPSPMAPAWGRETAAVLIPESEVPSHRVRVPTVPVSYGLDTRDIRRRELQHLAVLDAANAALEAR